MAKHKIARMWAVVDKSDGSILVCHPSRKLAREDSWYFEDENLADCTVKRCIVTLEK